MASTTLIHLISEQTMQNLLPLLAIQPRRVVQVCSQGERFAKIASQVEAAARSAGLKAEFQTHLLPSPTPEVEHVRRAMKQLLPVFPEAIVNLTGGTKPMFLGAYLGGSEFSVPLLYCDTDRKEFRALGDTPLPANLPTFEQTARTQLTLRTVMAAHGKAPEAWRFDTASAAALEFGRRAFDLRWHHRQAFQDSKFSAQIRACYRYDGGRIPSGAGKLRALLDANVLDALCDPVPQVVSDFLNAAASAGFLSQIPSGGYHFAPPPPDKKLQRHIETIANVLDGSWLELTVLGLVQSSESYIDAHWSVEPSKLPEHADAASFGETDVVALALPQGNLHVISCKTTMEKPLEHLEALHERAQNLGGRYARATLAVLLPRQEQIAELRRWERLLGIRILIGSDIQSLAK